MFPFIMCPWQAKSGPDHSQGYKIINLHEFALSQGKGIWGL